MCLDAFVDVRRRWPVAAKDCRSLRCPASCCLMAHHSRKSALLTQPIATNSPNPGPGSFGRTDAEGRFELELVKPAIRGAIIGEHRVMIVTPSG